MNKIELKSIEKSFKSIQVLKSISAEFHSGMIYGIIGNNGSGKTMLLRVISGLVYPNSGKVLINEKELSKGEILGSLGIIIEKPSFFESMTAEENLQILASLQGKIGLIEINDVLHKVELFEERNKKVSKYSLGMRQRLAFAQAIMENSDILLLDEPTNGLDKHGIQAVHQILREEKAAGKLIIITSHNPLDIEELCDEVYEIDGGRMTKYEN